MIDTSNIRKCEVVEEFEKILRKLDFEITKRMEEEFRKIGLDVDAMKEEI